MNSVNSLNSVNSVNSVQAVYGAVLLPSFMVFFNGKTCSVVETEKFKPGLHCKKL